MSDSTGIADTLANNGGDVANQFSVVKLAVYAFAVLFVGIVLWRVSMIMAKRKSKPKGSTYFDTKYQDRWKKK